MFDSHCHLTDERLRDEVDAVLERAWAAGLTGLVTIGASVEDGERSIEIAADHARVGATVGVHPHAAADAAGALGRIRDLAAREEVVAIGETGLDYHYDNAPRTVQRRAFEAQMGLAGELGLPVVVHARSADDDTAAMLRTAAGRVTGVLHCFTGGPRLLETALDVGWFISFSGLITFRNFEGGDLLREVPTDRLLIETDSPYLAPVPHRGRRNEPAFLPETCAAAARIRGEAVDALAMATTRNARHFYNLPESVQ